jgi:hypothetical protein
MTTPRRCMNCGAPTLQQCTCGQGIDELIAKSSLGDPEVQRIAARTPKHVVDEILRRVDAADRRAESANDTERLAACTKLARTAYRNAGLTAHQHEWENGHVGYEVLGDDDEDGLMVFVRSHPRALEAMEAALRVLNETPAPVQGKGSALDQMGITAEQLRDSARQFGISLCRPPRQVLDTAIAQEEGEARNRAMSSGSKHLLGWGADVMLYQGEGERSFRCSCGCNVFRAAADTGSMPVTRYRCNGCGDHYVGTKQS